MKQKTINIIFWITTILIVLFEGVLPGITWHTEFAKEGVRHLGFPDYFGLELVIFKVLGAVALIIPKVPSRLKEWAYFGFGLTSFTACIGHFVVDGFGMMTLFPLVFLAVIATSYIFYHKRK